MLNSYEMLDEQLHCVWMFACFLVIHTYGSFNANLCLIHNMCKQVLLSCKKPFAQCICTGFSRFSLLSVSSTQKFISNLYYMTGDSCSGVSLLCSCFLNVWVLMFCISCNLQVFCLCLYFSRKCCWFKYGLGWSYSSLVKMIPSNIMLFFTVSQGMLLCESFLVKYKTLRTNYFENKHKLC